MSVKSRNKSAKPKVDRPFDAKLFERARQIANQYRIVLEFSDGLYFGKGVEYPGAMNHGKTPDECVANTRDILTTGVAYMLEKGEIPPAPASEENRTEQINVRLTAEEKMRLEYTARSKGFRGISDYVRSVSLAGGR